MHGDTDIPHRRPTGSLADHLGQIKQFNEIKIAFEEK